MKILPLKYLFAGTLLTLACVQCRNISDSIPSVITLQSPDNVLSVQVFTTGVEKYLAYRVLYKSDTVVKDSKLGIVGDSFIFDSQLSIVDQGKVTNIIDNYTMVCGKRLDNTANGNEQIVTAKNSKGQILQIVLRAYNEGIAFRYIILGPENQSVTLTKELTTFSIPKGTAWLQPHGLPTEWGPAYEAMYPEVPVGTPAPDSSGYSFPALFRLQTGYYVLLSESDVQENYFGSRLQQTCESGVYAIRGPMHGDGLATGNLYAVAAVPFISPWRMFIISDKATEIANSNLVHHLALPSKVDDVSWIKPGRASWSWWSEHDSPKDFKRLKAYIDLAKEFGWEYSLVDANWDLMRNGGTINDLIAYANSKGVGLFLWYNSGGPHNNVTERPRDIMSDPVKRKEEFKKLAEMGIKGVKIDFFQSDKQNIIKLYLDILRDAAEAKIMVVFHGCTLPRGWSRTFPNLLSMEAILGAEQYGWSAQFARDAARHHTTVVFTRNVVGPMDYTPATFSDYACCPHQTTNAHELALPVLFESGITHWADKESSYRKLPAYVKNIMKAIPAAWEETMFLEGEPGKLAVVARKSGTDWYVAGINGDSLAKDMYVKLPFVANESKLDLYTDGSNTREVAYSTAVLNSGDSVLVKMLPKGGFLAKISR